MPHLLRSILLAAALTSTATAATIDPPKIFPTTAPASTPIKGMAVDGTVYPLADSAAVQASALVFVSTTCPISNKYVPELNRLAEDFHKRHGDSARLFAVISDPTVTRAAAAQYVKDYQIQYPVLFDASGELAERLRPSMTPEAFVLDAHGKVQYRGRIDDLWSDLRKQKITVASHDMADALDAVAAGKSPAVARTQSIGCIFEAWEARPKDAKVTYARDIAPILNANCVQCHREGQIAPFVLTSYDAAAKHARQMARVTDDRLMPPWKAEPNFGHFVDERRLSEREIALISQWSTAGAPKGDDAELPPSPRFASGWMLGEPDLVLEMPDGFTVPAAGRDMYRVFPVSLDIPEDRYVIGFEFKPGAPTVVHHALFFLDDKGQAKALAAKATDGLPGYRSFGGVGFTPSGALGGWAPGAMPFFLADGIGKPLHKGSDVVVQIHYHPDGKEHKDRSQLALYFSKKPVNQIAVSVSLMNRSIDIPAGENHYVRTATITAPRDVTLIGVTPHMHLVGRQMKVTAKKPDGTEIPLIYVKDWDFRWQDQYRFTEPVKLPAGSVVSLEAIYDNSTSNPDNPNSPPKRVTRGEQTTDEMCICFLNLSVDRALFAGSARVETLRWLLGARKAATQPTTRN